MTDARSIEALREFVSATANWHELMRARDHAIIALASLDAPNPGALSGGIILSPDDAALLKMSDLQLTIKYLREGGALGIAETCEKAAALISTLTAERDALTADFDRMVKTLRQTITDLYLERDKAIAERDAAREALKRVAQIGTREANGGPDRAVVCPLSAASEIREVRKFLKSLGFSRMSQEPPRQHYKAK